MELIIEALYVEKLSRVLEIIDGTISMNECAKGSFDLTIPNAVHYSVETMEHLDGTYALILTNVRLNKRVILESSDFNRIVFV